MVLRSHLHLACHQTLWKQAPLLPPKMTSAVPSLKVIEVPSPASSPSATKVVACKNKRPDKTPDIQYTDSPQKYNSVKNKIWNKYLQSQQKAKHEHNLRSQPKPLSELED